MTNWPNGRTSILAGVLRLARGDASGIGLFGHTVPSFLRSLIPLAALPVAIGLRTFAIGEGLRAIIDLAGATCVLLLPPVISHGLAKRWNREEWWLRYAIAFNWCQVGLTIACMALVIGLRVLFVLTGATTLTPGFVAGVVAFCFVIVGYGLWLHWFVARWGLGLSKAKAALVVLATYAGTFAVLLAHGASITDHG